MSNTLSKGTRVQGLEKAYIANNDAQRKRLETLVARLSDADLGRSLSHGWTVSAALAHLAFWDRYMMVVLERWEHEGVPPPSTSNVDAINEAALHQWLALPPHVATSEMIAAAETIDRKIEAFALDLIAAITASGRDHYLDRSIHRREHLHQIEAALDGSPRG